MSKWIVALLLSVGLNAQVALTPPVTTLLLMRHAETASSAADALLSEAGAKRADGWSFALGSYHPTALYSSSQPCAVATLQPAAKLLKLKATAWPTDRVKDLAEDILTTKKGGIVAVCWDQKNLKALALALGVPEPLAVWPENDYSQVWVIRLGADEDGAIDTGTQAAMPDPAGPSGYAAVWGLKNRPVGASVSSTRVIRKP